MQPPFAPATYIEHDNDFQKLIQKLSQQSLIALDTESNSLYAYRERVCLVQISTRSEDFIVDPLRVADLSALGPLLANPSIEKVFHAAEYDLMCMKRDYGFVVNNLFDTMLAARITGHKEMGLNKLLFEYFNIQADKSHQRDDWGQRPLPPDGLLYAQMDTHFLPELRDFLTKELQEQGQIEEARETFSEYADVTAANQVFDPNGYWRIGVGAGLSRRQMGILRELYLTRESIAEERDCPPFKVFIDKVLVALSEAAPSSMYELERVKGVPPAQVRRYGRPLLHAIERGKRGPLPTTPERPPDTDPVVVERFGVLRDWRKQRAEKRGVESDVIISKDALWGLALKAPKTPEDLHGIPGMGPWRLATYGEEILDVLKRFDDAT